MPRAATGQVIRRQSGAWALRFRAYGQRRYLTLGTAADGWSYTTARIELQNTLADVRRGIWSPVKPQPERLPDSDPRFRDFATNWLQMSQPEWEPKTVSDYEWQLVHHLLPFFGDHRSPISRSPRSIATSKQRHQKLGPCKQRSPKGRFSLRSTSIRTVRSALDESVPSHLHRSTRRSDASARSLASRSNTG